MLKIIQSMKGKKFLTNENMKNIDTLNVRYLIDYNISILLVKLLLKKVISYIISLIFNVMKSNI